MGFFRRHKRITCPKDTWTTLIWNFGSGMPAAWEIRFVPRPGATVQGRYVERRALWIFPQTPAEGALEPQMVFHRRWINAYYSLRVFPESDLIAELQRLV